jgi:hypothetical protein
MAVPTSARARRVPRRIDRFIARHRQEYYEHFAGLKDTLDLESIYARYEDVTTLEQAQRMARRDGSFGSIELWRFACDGYLGALTRQHEEELRTSRRS